MMFGPLNPLRLGASRERSGDRLFKELSEDRLKEGAFAVSVSASLVMLGKADEKNVRRAVQSVIGSKLDKTGAFQRAYSVLSAVFGRASEIESIKAFLAPLWEHGLDVRSRERGPLSYDEDISRALTEEGVIIDYTIPTKLRGALRHIGAEIGKALAESAGFREGLALLKAGKPTAYLEAQEWSKKVALLDRDMVIAIEATRRAMTSIGFEACPSGGAEGGARAVGPTGWSISCISRQVLADAIFALDTGIPTELIERTSKLVGELKFREYQVNEAQVRDQIAAVKSLPRLLGDVSDAIVNRASVFLHRSLIDSLAKLPASEDATRSYLCAPPPQRVYYQTSVGDVHVDVLFTHSLLSVQLHVPNHEDRVCRWTIGSDGSIRTWGRLELLPIDQGDLGLSQEEFSKFSAQVEAGSLALLKELSAIWEQYPGLYGALLPSTSTFGITRRSDGVAFSVARSDVNALLRHLGIDERHAEHRLEDSVCAADGRRVSVIIRELPAPTTQAPPAAPVEEPLKCPITRQFVADVCPKFGDFVRELRKFGVWVDTGVGSHQLLRREGLHSTVSKNQRDGTLVMNRHVIRAILQELEIPESEFVERTTRRSRE